MSLNNDQVKALHQSKLQARAQINEFLNHYNLRDNITVHTFLHLSLKSEFPGFYFCKLLLQWPFFFVVRGNPRPHPSCTFLLRTECQRHTRNINCKVTKGFFPSTKTTYPHLCWGPSHQRGHHGHLLPGYPRSWHPLMEVQGVSASLPFYHGFLVAYLLSFYPEGCLFPEKF